MNRFCSVLITCFGFGTNFGTNLSLWVLCLSLHKIDHFQVNPQNVTWRMFLWRNYKKYSDQYVQNTVTSTTYQELRKQFVHAIIRSKATVGASPPISHRLRINKMRKTLVPVACGRRRRRWTDIRKSSWMIQIRQKGIKAAFYIMREKMNKKG